MKKVKIEYRGAQAFRGTREFMADQIFYKNSGWMRELGYLPEGSKRKTWFPIAGKHDETNDYSETIVTIEEV